ncbi:Tyrosine-protein phosphatase pmp1 [Pseudocercospora fuligena]|uniref:protein-tyrosine-phosphatase n=1 Tax=Pseudocercospora fuligena TaxID=685502 RepID=A0A8H6R8E0_9PEZI|nr:Tyrosine-protein phosphatase pmp1 [Pseudocercospora fuligena]
MSHMDEQTKQLPQPSISSSQRSLQPSPEYESFVRKFHQHQLSDSTNTTGSNDSSPTTTISTVDDSSATEPSPGSSPESPPPTTFAVGMLRPRTADDRSAPFFELQKQPPPRKGRNLKNLAVNTSRHGPRAASTTSLPLQVQPDQNASVLSPSFVKPPTPPRRKPSNLGLTILTPGGGKPASQEIKLAIPPTPGVARPSLRHFQSSPSLPLMPSLGVPHYNASDFQKPRLLETIFSPVEQPAEAPQIAEEEEEEEQNFDVPLSREEKPEAYPDGPICVYDPSIDLYLEPTAEQARQYDVIMNVASEVRNPLLGLNEPDATEPELRIDGGGGIQFAPKKERDHLVVKKEDALAQDASSPTTPKASPLNATFPTKVSTVNDPEYIHIPWEHNSDIVPDLLRLCKLIDDKVTQGKRVLIHCQCGVSRSASLVVAYGLYKNPSMSVQEAYDAVKKRSKWIGPNMNLIMQLQEFRSSLARGGLLTARSAMSPLTPGSALSEWNGPFATISPAMRNEPLSAVEPPSANAASNGDRGVLSPGPSSAPSGFPWPLPTTSGAQRQRSISAVKPATAYVDPSGHVLPVQPVLPVLQVIAADAVHAKPPGPVRQVSSPEGFSSQTATESVGSPRSAEFAMTPLQPSKEVEAADDFGIMSPTSTEFTTSPFDRSALLAQLGMGSMRADEDTPRRSISLRNRERQQYTMRPGHSEQSRKGLEATQPRRLRGKVSSPSLHEQQELQALQAKIEADLSIQRSNSNAGSPQFGQLSSAAEEPLMSPRATEFTSNPFALSLSVPPPTSENNNNNTSTRMSDIDPRSPAHKGASPITRSILDVL